MDLRWGAWRGFFIPSIFIGIPEVVPFVQLQIMKKALQLFATGL